MFGFGFGQILLILLIALIFLGPDQLPQVARNLARFLNELKRGADSFKHEFMKHNLMDEEDPAPCKNPSPPETAANVAVESSIAPRNENAESGKN